MLIGDLIVLAIIVLPVIVTFALLRAEPVRLNGLGTPAVR
jgi:hypothetical protein